jgi:DNA mismatch endonuclease (patch repair protein)
MTTNCTASQLGNVSANCLRVRKISSVCIDVDRIDVKGADYLESSSMKPQRKTADAGEEINSNRLRRIRHSGYGAPRYYTAKSLILHVCFYMDRVTPQARSRIMSLVKPRDGRTTEKRLRALLVQRGIAGWRMHGCGLPGRPDFVFETSLCAVFVDGCFWHGCKRCRKASKSNVGFWREKVKVNPRRDIRVSRRLRAAGWSVFRIRECELKDPLRRSRRLAEIETQLRRNK